MSKFKVGVKVVTIESGKVRNGVIEKTFDNINIALVKFENGDIEKVHMSRLGIVEQEEKPVEEKPSKPVEKSEITITPDEFKKTASKVIAKSVEKMENGGGLLTLTFTLLIVELHRALFYDAVEND